MIEIFRGEHAFLSNFWPVQIGHEGIWYPSVEHAYQSSKTLDPHQKKVIHDAPTAAKARQRGNHVTIRHDWDNVKLGVMRALVYRKFKFHEDLHKLLIATGAEPIIHMNNWGDTFWGVCSETGKNHLGIILMHVRNELR